MDLIQGELDQVCHIWNTHLIRYSRQGISGRPNELYFLPNIHGLIIIFPITKDVIMLTYILGYEDCKFPYDVQDLQFCKQYTAPKPAPADMEFLQLVEILLEENQWFIPTSNCEESLLLCLNLINEIES